jgi:hypothetical protein
VLSEVLRRWSPHQHHEVGWWEALDPCSHFTHGVHLSSVFSQSNIAGVYIPSVLLIVGVAIIKTEYVPYAVAVAALVGGLKVFASSSRK